MFEAAHWGAWINFTEPLNILYIRVFLKNKRNISDELQSEFRVHKVVLQVSDQHR